MNDYKNLVANFLDRDQKTNLQKDSLLNMIIEQMTTEPLAAAKQDKLDEALGGAKSAIVLYASLNVMPTEISCWPKPSSTRSCASLEVVDV